MPEKYPAEDATRDGEALPVADDVLGDPIPKQAKKALPNIPADGDEKPDPDAEELPPPDDPGD